MKQGDVFIARYDALRVGTERDLQPGKFLAPATALFCHAPEMDAPFAVVPLAIQCATGRPDGETAVFTPLSELRWRAAKRLVGVADVNPGASFCLHLARTHFMTVPFAIALRRKLPRAHPLHLFLMPHLRFNLFVDRMAWLQGVRKTSGVLVRSLAGRAEWCQDVARSVYYEHSFREQHFERDLEARGLDAHPVDYPYRDDGRLLWSAIQRFTDGYVRSAYADDRALAADAHLHEFLRDVTAPDGGGNVRRPLLAGARLETRDELVEILTQILFVAGPLHALAHYSSAAQLQHVSDNPSFLTANPLSTLDDTEPGPLGGMTQYTRVVGTNCRYDRLGDFSRHELGREGGASEAHRRVPGGARRHRGDDQPPDGDAARPLHPTFSRRASRTGSRSSDARDLVQLARKPPGQAERRCVASKRRGSSPGGRRGEGAAPADPRARGRLLVEPSSSPSTARSSRPSGSAPFAAGSTRLVTGSRSRRACPSATSSTSRRGTA